MLGIPNPEEAPPTPQRTLSPLGEACSRTDLTAIHQLFVISDYREDDGNHEVIFCSFQNQLYVIIFRI